MGQPAYTLCEIKEPAEPGAKPRGSKAQAIPTASDLAVKLTADDINKVNLAPRQDWLDSELLAEGFAANPTTFRALQQLCGFSDEQAASACLVSPRTYRRWRSKGKPDPTAVRLLAILAGFVPWIGWDDWEMHRGYLFPPGFSRHGITPGQIQAIVFYRQQISEYRRLNAELTARVRALEAERTTAPSVEPDPVVGCQIQALATQVQALAEELSSIGERACSGSAQAREATKVDDQGGSDG